MIRQLLTAAAASDRSFSIGAEGEIDYRGANVAKAMRALNDCDELDIVIYEHRNGNAYRCGSVYFVWNGTGVNDPDNICDAGGWANDWLDDNADY